MAGCRPLNPIESELMEQALHTSRNGLRDATLWAVGIRTGFRISELLSLRRSDTLTQSMTLREAIRVHRNAMKGGRKSREFPLHGHARVMLTEYLTHNESRGYIRPVDFVFQSERAGNHAITNRQAWRIFTTTAARIHIDGRIGTHTMRKTFAEMLYRAFIERQRQGEAIEPLRAVSRALGHDKLENTELYLGLMDRTIDAVAKEIF